MDSYPTLSEFNPELSPQPNKIIVVDGERLVYQNKVVSLAIGSQELLNIFLDAGQPLTQAELLQNQTIDELMESVWLLSEDIKETEVCSNPITRESTDNDITYSLSPEINFVRVSKSVITRLARLSIKSKLYTQQFVKRQKSDDFFPLDDKAIRTTELYRIASKLSNRPSDVPEGWITRGALAAELGVDFVTMKKMAAVYEPEFRQFTDRGGSLSYHLSPEAADKIRELLNSTNHVAANRAPQG